MVAHACNPSYSDAEGGESLELGRQRLQWAKIITTALQPGQQSSSVSKKKKKQNKYPNNVKPDSFTAKFYLTFLKN